MPEHCINILHITGPSDDLSRMEEAVSGRAGPFDFSEIIPARAHTIKTFLWGTDRPAYDIVSGRFEVIFRGRAAARPTKERTENSQGLFYQFHTAWTPPLPILAELARRYPQLGFLFYHSADGGEQTSGLIEIPPVSAFGADDLPCVVPCLFEDIDPVADSEEWDFALEQATDLLREEPWEYRVSSLTGLTGLTKLLRPLRWADKEEGPRSVTVEERERGQRKEAERIETLLAQAAKLKEEHECREKGEDKRRYDGVRDKVYEVVPLRAEVPIAGLTPCAYLTVIIGGTLTHPDLETPEKKMEWVEGQIQEFVDSLPQSEALGWVSRVADDARAGECPFLLYQEEFPLVQPESLASLAKKVFSHYWVTHARMVLDSLLKEEEEAPASRKSVSFADVCARIDEVVEDWAENALEGWSPRAFVTKVVTEAISREDLKEWSAKMEFACESVDHVIGQDLLSGMVAAEWLSRAAIGAPKDKDPLYEFLHDLDDYRPVGFHDLAVRAVCYYHRMRILDVLEILEPPAPLQEVSTPT